MWPTCGFFALGLISLICVGGLWVMYFFVYGFIKLICHKPIICLWIGIVVFIMMGLFPPCYWPSSGKFLGWHSISSFQKYPMTYAKIYTSLLFTQWIMVAVITGGLLLTFQGKKKD
jgi:hypothetical protein